MSVIATKFKKLSELRIRAGLTQTQLALTSKTNTALISRLENGTHSPRPKNALKICEALGVEFDDIFEIVEVKKEALWEAKD